MNSSVMPAVVARLHGGDRIVRVLALAVHDRAQRALGAIPALVAIHRVVAARDGRDPVDGQLGEVVHRRVRRDVAAVGERMDPGLLRRERRAAPGDGRCASGRRRGRRARAGGRSRRARRRRAVPRSRTASRLDRPVHAHEILVEDAARADRQMADLGVAHLAVRQADGLARGGELRVRIVAPQPVEDRRLGELDRVAGPGGAIPQPSRMTSATRGYVRPSRISP